MNELTITAVVDPMMGMVWETWPIMRKLESHFGNQINFRLMMGQLVNDVYKLVDPNVSKKFGHRVALNQYWTRLMQVYLQEEQISGMPIYMGGHKPLFDEQHTSSTPLNKGLLAIAGHDNDLAWQVLYEMQYDTVMKDLQTNDIQYLTNLAKRFGIEPDQFKQRYDSTDVANELKQSQTIIQQMKIDQLPAYLISYNSKTYLIKGIPTYDQWLQFIKQIAMNQIEEEEITFNWASVQEFINRHPHTSSLEIKEAFDADSEKQVINLLHNKPLNQEKIKSTVFYRKNN